jgi:hypothetical protein
MYPNAIPPASMTEISTLISPALAEKAFFFGQTLKPSSLAPNLNMKHLQRLRGGECLC